MRINEQYRADGEVVMNPEQRYRLLYHISRRLNQQNLDLDGTLHSILSLTSEAMSVQHGCLLTIHEEQRVEHVYLLGESGTSSTAPDLWAALLHQGLIGYVYYADRPVIIRSITGDPRWPHLPEPSPLPQSGSAMGLPLSQDGRIYGVMLFAHPQVDYFDPERAALLTEIAELATISLLNAQEHSAVRTADGRYQALFDDAVVPIILTDRKGTILDANYKACDFLGYERRDLIGVPIMDINIRSLENYGVLDLNIEEETTFRTTIYDIDGLEIPTLLRARRLSLDRRDIIEFVLQDMTPQMELEQLRRDLTAMVYHDLRGPLQNIVGSIYKLGEVLRNHDNPAVLIMLQLGLRSTRQLQRMVDSLLDIQRLEEGKAILNRRPVEMRVLLTDAIQLVQPLATEADQQIVVETDKNIPMALLDSDMILRVVINLIENAIKYTPDGGRIQVRAQVQGAELQVSVTDSGPGIPDHMKQRIFDKFSRVRYDGGPKGVGLGLAFCRLAIEAHQGRIWVESTEGTGSEFIFALPIPQKEVLQQGGLRSKTLPAPVPSNGSSVSPAQSA